MGIVTEIGHSRQDCRWAVGASLLEWVERLAPISDGASGAARHIVHRLAGDRPLGGGRLLPRDGAVLCAVVSCRCAVGCYRTDSSPDQQPPATVATHGRPAY